MFFTIEDYKKIQEWLSRNSIKDTEFNEAMQPFKGNEIISFVQNGHNTKAYLKDFVDQLFLLGIPDFVNVTEKFDESNISLSRAIQLIPYKSRKIGQVITFLNEEGVWKIYQFKGKRRNQWNEESLWVDIIRDIASKITTLADEEDITTVEENGATVFKFKDKAYSPDSFSGKGRVYLRKNIVTVKDPETGNTYKTNLLTQEMLGKENTIYIIQYDYNLNGQTITIPEECVLQFEGGSFNNGKVDLKKGSSIEAGKYDYIFRDIEVLNEDLFEYYITWFGVSPNNKSNNDAFVKAVSGSYRLIKIPAGVYEFSASTMDCYIQYASIVAESFLDPDTSSHVVFNIPSPSSSDYGISLFRFYTYVLDIQGITFFGTGWGSSCIELVDYYLKGNMDSSVRDCSFNKFIYCIITHGRGIDVENNLFRSVQYGVRYIPASEQANPNEPTQNPPFDGRAIKIFNNRGHVIDHFLLMADYNELQPDACIQGMIFTNNVIDTEGALLYSRIPIMNSIINDNILLGCKRATEGPIILYNYIKNVTIVGNVCNNISSSLSNSVIPNNNIYIVCDNLEKTIEDVVISNNVFGVCSRASIHLGTSDNTSYPNTINISNINISNNVFTDCREGLQFFRAVADEIILCDNLVNSRILNLNNSTLKTSIISDIKLKLSGTSSERPSSLDTKSLLSGFQYFDTTLNKPIWWTGTKWVDATGASV